MATIFCLNHQSDLPLECCDLPDAIHTILRLYRKTAREISLHFIPCDEMRRLHQHYFDDDAPTDCIGFPLHLGNALFGDIFICPRTALCYARENGVDPYWEVMRYMVHALLHFFGFKDGTLPARAAMRRREDRVLKHLKEKGYALDPL